jgi:hypothetical protein
MDGKESADKEGYKHIHSDSRDLVNIRVMKLVLHDLQPNIG